MENTDPRKNRKERVLRIAKGSASISLSRRFVEFVIDTLNLSNLMALFDSMPYGTDEMLFHSLHSDDLLGKFSKNISTINFQNASLHFTTIGL